MIPFSLNRTTNSSQGTITPGFDDSASIKARAILPPEACTSSIAFLVVSIRLA